MSFTNKMSGKKEQPLLIKKIKYDYKYLKSAPGKLTGIPTNGLSPAYFAKVTEEKTKVEKLITAMSNQFKCNFELEVNFLPTGEADFNRLSFKLVKTFSRNYENGSPMPMLETVLAFEQVVALSSYMSEVSIHGFKNELCYFTADITCTHDELISLFNKPFADDTLVQQWASIMRTLENTYSRNHYSFTGTMPVYDGELSLGDLEICVSSKDVLGG